MWVQHGVLPAPLPLACGSTACLLWPTAAAPFVPRIVKGALAWCWGMYMLSARHVAHLAHGGSPGQPEGPRVFWS